jgi:putative flavoprotein involved in K+ transport
MSETRRIPVLVIGGGQAGLSVSWHLSQHDVEHLVVEREEIFGQWKHARWDTFCLVTPNWQCVLPGYAYDGADPDGFMVKQELLDWLARYPRTFDPPVSERTDVTSLRPREDGDGFDVQTSIGPVYAEQVVVATGGYGTPAIPRMAERIPPRIAQLHSSRYKNPDVLADGAVLVVGSGQSGAQIAEDLHLAGRTVHLAVGEAPRVARRYRGRDVVAWLQDMGHYDKPVSEQPPEERHRDRTNHYVTGRDGGRDIDLRAFAEQGMSLHGRLLDVTGEHLSFADGLAADLDAADAVYNGINAAIDNYILGQGIQAPPGERYTASWHPDPGPSTVSLADISTVIWATGFSTDYRWLHAPVFDGSGHPQHRRGITGVPGLYFLGLPWLHTWGSGRFAAVARDAEHLAGAIIDRHSRTQRPDLAGSLA